MMRPVNIKPSDIVASKSNMNEKVEFESRSSIDTKSEFNFNEPIKTSTPAPPPLKTAMQKESECDFGAGMKTTSAIREVGVKSIVSKSNSKTTRVDQKPKNEKDNRKI